MHILTKKRALGALATLAVLAVAGVAFAYFTSTGGGTGEAKVGTSTTFTITGSTTSGSLYPGTNEAVKFSVHNPGNGTQYLDTISLSSVAACSIVWVGEVCNSASAGVGDLACKSVDPGNAINAGASDFYMTDVPQKIQIPAGATENKTTTPATIDGTLYMNNLSSSQDICKNAHLLLTFASN